MTELAKLEEFISAYVNNVLDGMQFRATEKVQRDWYSGEVSSVLNGLIGRQATLSIKLAQSPTNWDGHLAPLVLRTMADCHISFEWILRDPIIRAREYIGYSLGQAKLSLSHYQDKLAEHPDDKFLKDMIDLKQAWISHHKIMEFVEVNLGSWSGSSVRSMAQDIGDEDFYKFSFTPFSSCVHNTWEHIHAYNTDQCSNPMHKYHMLPSMRDAPIDPDYLFRSAKYLTMSFRSYDQATGISGGPIMPMSHFNEHIDRVFDSKS